MHQDCLRKLPIESGFWPNFEEKHLHSVECCSFVLSFEIKGLINELKTSES